MNRIVPFLLCILSFSLLANAQPLDSLKNALQTATDTTKVEILQKIGLAVIKNKPDSAITVFEQSLELATTVGYGRGIVKAYSGIAYGYELTNDKKRVVDNYHMAIEAAAKHKLFRDQGKQYLHLGNYYAVADHAIQALGQYKNALRLLEQVDDTDQQITVYLKIGDLYSNQGESVEALKNYFKALEMIELINDTKSLSSVYNNIAIVYKKQKNIKDALEYYHKALEITEKFDDQMGRAITNVNIALIHKDNRQLDTARAMLKRSLKYFEEIEHQYAQTQVQHNLSVVYYEGNQIDSALYFLDQSQEIANRFGYKKVESKNHIHFAKIYQKQGRYDAALAQIERSIAIATSISSTENIEEALGIKYKIYEDKGEPGNAYLALKEYQKYHDSLFNSVNSKQIGVLKTMFELKAKEKEIALLEKEKEIQNLNAYKKRVLNYSLISGIITLGLISFILLLSRNNKSKANKLLKKQSLEIRSKKEEIEMQKAELLEKNKHLESLNEDKNRLIGMVAHDLRSPLNQIKGLIGILKVTVNTDTEGKEVIEKMDDSTDRLRELVNRTLDLKAIESNKISLNKEVVDLGSLVQSVINNFTQNANEKSITIIDKVAKDSCFVNVDKNYTIQIIENLLCNALKFSHMRSEVQVLVYAADNKVKLEVIDEGPGLSKKDQEKLFKPYQRLSAQPTNKEKSTGLGLAIVKKYTKAMGGKVSCESQLGQGAKFVVLFDMIEMPFPTVST